MQVTRPFGLSNDEAVKSFIDLDDVGEEDLLDAYAYARKAYDSGKEATGFLVKRATMLKRIGAAYARRDSGAVKKTIDAFLANGLAKSRSSSAALLSLDLGLAISTGRHKDAKALARKSLEDTEAVAQPYPTALCGQILAALFDIDLKLAGSLAETLREKCAGKDYDKFDCEVFGAWAEAASVVAGRGSETALVDNFKRMAAARREWIDKELGQWQRGGNTDLSSSEFFDWLAAALATIAGEFGYRLDPQSDSFAFSDWRWVREAK